MPRIQRVKKHSHVKYFLLHGSLLSSTSLLQCQVNHCAIAHVVISQGVGIFNEHALKNKQKNTIIIL